jgi:hypothetical protein
VLATRRCRVGRETGGQGPNRLGLKSDPKLKTWNRLVSAYTGFIGIGIVNE